MRTAANNNMANYRGTTSSSIIKRLLTRDTNKLHIGLRLCLTSRD